MKKITGLVIALAVLLLGGYYGMGVITERTVKNNLAIVNQSNGLYAEVVNYNRGWFKSQALLDWNLHVPARIVKSASGQTEIVPAQDYRLEMPLIISHGPVIFADQGVMLGLGYAHTNLVLPANLLTQFNAYFTKESTQPKMELSLLVDYLNNSRIDMTVPQFNLIAKQKNMTFDWMGMLSSVKTTGSLSDVNGHFAVNGVRFAQDKIVVTLGKVSGKYNLHKTAVGLFFGDSSTLVPSIVVKNNDEKIFELDEFAVDTNTGIEKDLFTANFKTSIEKLFANGKNFGPGHLEVATKNLDATVFANISAQIKKAQQGTELEKQQAMLAILPELPKLFGQGAVVDVATSLVVPEGTVEGNVLISLPIGSSLANPFELIQKTEGSGRLLLPAQLVNELVTQSVKQKLVSKALTPPQSESVQPTGTPASQSAVGAPDATATDKPVTSFAEINQQVAAQTAQEIKEMLQSGLLVQQGDNYLIEIKLNQGKILVNSKPFSPSMLKF